MDCLCADLGLTFYGPSVPPLPSFSSYCGHLVCPLIPQPKHLQFPLWISSIHWHQEETHSVPFSSSRCLLPSSFCLFWDALQCFHLFIFFNILSRVYNCYVRISYSTISRSGTLFVLNLSHLRLGVAFAILG